MKINLGPYSKAVAAAIGLLLEGATQRYGGGNMWVAAAVGLAAILGVYAVPNIPKKPPAPPAEPPAGGL